MGSMTKINDQLKHVLYLANDIEIDECDERHIPPIKEQIKKNVEEIIVDLNDLDMYKFTVDEFKKYLSKQDSFGDAFYNLKPENVKNAQSSWCKDCKRYAKCKDVFDQPEVNGETVACPQYDGK